MTQSDLFPKEPYKCSSWSPTSTCSESCGNGRYLETRSCLPVHPEIPEELLASPPVTIKDGSSPCSQSPCTGEVYSLFDDAIRKTWTLGVVVKMSGKLQ